MRIIISIGLLCAVGAACFAQDDREIDALIRNGLNKNFEAIQEEADDLDAAERLAIYNRHQRSKFLWIGAAAPFGIGNFIQKDYAWGSMVLAGEIIGGGLIYVGAAMFAFPIFTFWAFFSEEGARVLKIGMYLMPIGGITMALSQIAGMIRVFTHVPAYNKKLKKALLLDSLTVSIEPSVSVTGRSVGLTLVSASF